MEKYAIKITNTDEDKAVCALMNQFDWGCDSHVPEAFPVYRTADTIYFSGAEPTMFNIVSGNDIWKFFLKRQWEDKPVEPELPLTPEQEKYKAICRAVNECSTENLRWTIRTILGGAFAKTPNPSAPQPEEKPIEREWEIVQSVPIMSTLGELKISAKNDRGESTCARGYWIFRGEGLDALRRLLDIAKPAPKPMLLIPLLAENERLRRELAQLKPAPKPEENKDKPDGADEWKGISENIHIGKGDTFGVYLKISNKNGYIGHQEVPEVIRYLRENFPQFFAPQPDSELVRGLVQIRSELLNYLRDYKPQPFGHILSHIDALIGKAGK